MVEQGLPHNVDASSLSVEDGEYMKYMSMELPLLKSQVRYGLMFALRGEIMVGTKVYKRWLALRPALQMHAIAEYGKAIGIWEAGRLNQTKISLSASSVDECSDEQNIEFHTK